MNNDEFINTGFYIVQPRGDGSRDDARYGKTVNVDLIHQIPISDNKKDNSELIGLLHEALDNLTDSQKQAIDLIFFQQMSIRDASRIAKITKASMQDRYEQAIKSLQQNVHELPYGLDRE